MEQFFEGTKTYIAKKSETFIGLAVVLVLVLIVVVIAVLVQTDGFKIVYQPTKACDLLTPHKAEDLLGDKVYSTDKNEPTIAGNLAASKCSYTDENPDQSQMKVAAVAVQSGINDAGVSQNKANFAAKKPKTGINDVKGVGQTAYFNPATGQLNVLSGRNWIIVSYGTGTTPSAFTMDDAVKLAHKVLE